MNCVTCKNCGEAYFYDYGHYCKHDDCLASRINSNYPVFLEKGKSQEISYLPSEVHNQSASTSGDFYSLTNDSALAPFTPDGSVPFPTYQTNMISEHGSQVQCHQPTFMSTEHWNVHHGFPLPSQHEGYANPSVNESYPFTHEPVCLTSFHNDDPFSLQHESNNKRVNEIPTNIQMNEMIEYNVVYEEKNQIEANKINFPSTSWNLSNNLSYCDPTVADVAQSFPFTHGPVCSTPIHNSQILNESNFNKRTERQTNIQTTGTFKSSIVFEKKHKEGDNNRFLSTSMQLSENPPDYDPAIAGPSHRSHAGHICPVCRKEFSNKSRLKQHSVVHSEEKPFVCDVCQKSYARKDHLDRHMRFHKKIKPHKCQQCGKAFTLKQDLKSHMRTHTGEKPFKCKLCVKAFAQWGNLQRHARIHKRMKSV